MGLLSPRMLLLFSIVVLVLVHDTEAWRSRRWRIRLPRIRLPRIRLPRISLRRVIRLPRLRRIADSIRRFTKPCIRSKFIRVSRGCPPPPPPPAVPVTPSSPCDVIKNRAAWAAPPPATTFPFRTLPLQKVAVFVVGDACTTLAACTAIAKSHHNTTTNYNFLVGTDGSVFEGMGWDWESKSHYYSQSEYSVAMIGKPDAECALPEQLWEAFGNLIDCGVENNKLPATLDENDIDYCRYHKACDSTISC